MKRKRQACPDSSAMPLHGLIDGVDPESSKRLSGNPIWYSLQAVAQTAIVAVSRFLGIPTMMEGKRRCLDDVVEQAYPDWSGMPLDILRIIAGLIDGVEDYIRFGAVCRSWKSATFCSYDDCPKSSKRRLEYPWLMLVQNKTGGTKRGFYSLHSGKEFYLDLPECHDRVCFGTPCGRLVTIGPDREVHLLNPLTRKRLPLPLLPSKYKTRRGFPNDLLYTVIKALVVWDGDIPTVFVVFYSPKFVMALARTGDRSWTRLGQGYKIQNIELFRGQVWAFTLDKIHMVDLSLSPPRLKEFSAAPLPYHKYDLFIHVVDVGGDLLAIQPLGRKSQSRTYMVNDDFVVYKLDMVERNWKQVHSLGGWTVFVGRNSSFALPSSTRYPLCRPNCIYFTDIYFTSYDVTGGRDLGIFSLELQPIEEFTGRNGQFVMEGDEFVDLNAMSRHPFPISNDQYSTFCPPLWLAPNVW